MLAVYAAASLVAHRTRFGRSVYATGGNRALAERIDLPVAATTMLVCAFSSLCAGIIMSLYSSASYPLAAVGVELSTIAAVVIEGPMLSGGFGFVASTLVGVLIQGMIQTYITFDGTLSTWWTKTAIGLLLVRLHPAPERSARAGSGPAKADRTLTKPRFRHSPGGTRLQDRNSYAKPLAS